MAASFSIQDRYARASIQQGTSRLRALQEQTGLGVQGLHQAVAGNQRDSERRGQEKAGGDARWDDFSRGNGSWISDLEGGKVHQTGRWGTRDSSTGDRVEGGGSAYLHIEGENPVHPSEHTQEIRSHEPQQLLERGR
jgi:hypothetical protein